MSSTVPRHDIRTPSPAAEAALVHSASSSSFDVVSTSSNPRQHDDGQHAEPVPAPSSTPWSRVSSRPDLDVVTTPEGSSSCVEVATPRSDGSVVPLNFGTATPSGTLVVVPTALAAPTVHIYSGVTLRAEPAMCQPNTTAEARGGAVIAGAVPTHAFPPAVAAAAATGGPFGRRGGPAARNGQCPWVNWQCQIAELQRRSRHVALRRNAAPALLTAAAEKRRGKPSPAQLRGAKLQHHHQHHHYHHHTEQRKSFHPRSDVKAVRTKAPAAAPVRRRK